MDGHEGNEARRAATVAQARTDTGIPLALLVVGVPACRPPTPGSGTGVRITDIYGERLPVGGIAVWPGVARPTGVRFARH